MTNFKGSMVRLDMDLDEAVTDGIYLPSVRQTDDGSGCFHFRFIAPEKGWFYKLYYQNESYKFPDTAALSSENFYGSWEDVSVGFKPVDRWWMRDSLRIVGNPRDEKIYYGADVSENYRDQKHVDSIKQCIRNSESWYKSVIEKAAQNQISVDAQLTNDALWVVEDDLNHGDHNHRWKRNPRVGEYAFTLVLCDEEGLAEIPDHIQHLGATAPEGGFENPFHWFASHPSKHIKVITSGRKLKTRAVLEASHGVYVEEAKMKHATADSCGRGYNKELYRHALFEQFFSSISQQYTLRNIPVIQDVVGEDPYTRAEYEANKTRFDSSQLQMNYPVVTENPCATVHATAEGITLVNPASTEGRLRKESTGIRSRVGFTYGKFRGKIKFPVMLNDENIWNGLTYCASGDYVQTFTAANNCDSVVTLHLTTGVGIQNHDLNVSMIVYPNPTTNILNVQCTINDEQWIPDEIHLFDAYGKLVFQHANLYETPQQTVQIDMSQFAYGLYFVKAVKGGKVVAVRKVVKS